MEHLSIGAVARITGLSEFTLRAWERRYEGLKPKRLKSGRRVYSVEDVEKLSLLGKLTAEGHAVSEIINLDAIRLAELVHRLKGSAAREEGQTSGLSSARLQVNDMLAAVKDLDVGRLVSLLRITQMQLNTRSFLIDIVALFLRELGAHVVAGKLDVFHEHAASAVVRNFLTGILFSTEQSVRSLGQAPVVFAAPEGDHHEFGILIAALLVAMRGNNVFYLGPNMPFGSLERAARMTKSPLIVVGSAAPSTSVTNIQLNEYMDNLARRVAPTTEIWIGGGRAGELKSTGELRRIKRFTNLSEFDRALTARSVL